MKNSDKNEQAINEKKESVVKDNALEVTKNTEKVLAKEKVRAKAVKSEVLTEISDLNLNDAFKSVSKSDNNEALKIWAKALETIKKKNELMLYNVCEDVSLVEYKNGELIVGLQHGGSFNMLTSFKERLLGFIKETTPIKSLVIKKIDEKITESETEIEKKLKEKFKDKLIIIQ